MKVKELILKLSEFPDNMEVMARDCVGYRSLVGPYSTDITEEDCNDHADCEEREGGLL